MQWHVNDKTAVTEYDGKVLTVGELKKQLALAEMSNRALLTSLKRVRKVAKSRLIRMNKLAKALVEARLDAISNVGGF